MDRIWIAKALMDFYATHPLPPHLEQLQLDSFLFCFTCALSDVPRELHPQVWDGMRRIAVQHRMFDTWPERLHFLRPVPLLLLINPAARCPLVLLLVFFFLLGCYHSGVSLCPPLLLAVSPSACLATLELLPICCLSFNHICHF